jgi:hypothetical protein
LDALSINKIEIGGRWQNLPSPNDHDNETATQLLENFISYKNSTIDSMKVTES